MMFQSVETEFVAFEQDSYFCRFDDIGLVRIRIVEDLKEAQAKQNADKLCLLAKTQSYRSGFA